MPGSGRYAPVLIILAIALLILSCSRRTLSIFFDGVPPEADTTMQMAASRETDSINAANSKSLVSAVNGSIHVPYQDKECGACHDQDRMGKFILDLGQPALCYQCHEDFSATYSMLHAAVEGGSCTDCHNPHKSDYDKLLIMEEKLLCFTCHDGEDETWKEIHDGIDDAKCTDCHNPHGSNDSGLLK